MALNLCGSQTASAGRPSYSQQSGYLDERQDYLGFLLSKFTKHASHSAAFRSVSLPDTLMLEREAHVVRKLGVSS